MEIKKKLNLWKNLVKQCKSLNDNNYTARKIYDYIQKYYKI